MGRSFHSPSGSGIYLSLILRPNCHAMQLMHLTCAVGVAVCDAIENTCGLRPGIKWINDLVCQNRKLGGILTELSISSDGTVTYAVVGIGINCSQKEQDFPEDIRKIATSLSLATGIDFPRNQVVAAMLESLERMSRSLLKEQDRIMDMYRKDCITIGREVTVVGADPIRRGIATGVDHAGSLLITFSDGHKEALNSGEVSVRGIYGYI